MLTEDRVAVRLHADVDDIHAPADLAATVRRRHTRRTRALIGIVAVPMVVAAVAALALVAAPTDPTNPTRPNRPNLRNAAHVAERAVAALEGAADRMAHIRGTIVAPGMDGQTLEQWRDPAGSRWRVDAIGPDGQARRAMLVAGPDDGTRTVLTVDYADRAWWAYRLEQPDTPSDVSWISMFDDPDDIREALRLWSLHLVGDERVDGQDTVHLGGPKPTGRGIAIDIWVDAATYLPVRITVVSPDLSMVSRYTWLARTPQNLAPFELTAPAGFTQRQH